MLSSVGFRRPQAARARVAGVLAALVVAILALVAKEAIGAVWQLFIRLGWGGELLKDKQLGSAVSSARMPTLFGFRSRCMMRKPGKASSWR